MVAMLFRDDTAIVLILADHLGWDVGHHGHLFGGLASFAALVTTDMRTSRYVSQNRSILVVAMNGPEHLLFDG